ncbi:hypothetical protein ACTFIZ_004994 [Dictyostelium cf. discoideum]
MHIKRKHSKELEAEKQHQMNIEYSNDFIEFGEDSNDENQNYNHWIEQENKGKRESGDSEKDDFDSDYQSDDEEVGYDFQLKEDNEEDGYDFNIEENENNIEIYFEEVKCYNHIKHYLISDELFKSTKSNQINDFSLFIFKKYLENNFNKASLEDFLGEMKNSFQVVNNKNNQKLKFYSKLQTLVSQFKRTVKYQYPIEPIKYELEVNNKQGLPFKKIICFNEILECIVALIKIPHIRNKLKLETLDLETDYGRNIKVNQINIGIFSDSYSKGKAASSNIINFTLEDFIDDDLKRFFIFPLACIKNDHEVKLTDQINFQKVLDIIFKNLVDFLNSNSYFILNNENYVIKLIKIYGDLPGLSLFLNIAFFSKQVGGCHTCLAPSEKMNYIHIRYEKKKGEKARQLYDEGNPIKKDKYGLKDPQDIFETIQKCFLHHDLLGMVKREITEVYDILNKKSKELMKQLFTSLPIINGVNLRGFDLKFFVGKEYRYLLEVFSIILSEIIQTLPSSDLLKRYLNVIFIHEEYLKLLLCSNEYFLTKEEKTNARYIINLIFSHREEYLKIRKNILETRYTRKCKRNKGSIDKNAMEKFKEKGLMVLHLGIHYIEDLETGKNPINHTGQDMESSIRDYKRIETTKSNNKYGYSIMKSSNLKILNRINSKIKKINNYENKCFYIKQKKEDILEIEIIKKKIQSERNDIDDFEVSIISSIKFRDQVYTKGNYISLDYEFSSGPNKIKTINYSIINEIIEINYSNKKEVLILVDFSSINEFHTNIFRVIYDIETDRTIENSSIVSLYSLNNLVYRWDISKIYGSAFTIIDLYRPKNFAFPNTDPSQLITLSKLNNLKKSFLKRPKKRNVKNNDELVFNNSTNSSLNNSYNSAFFKLTNFGDTNESYITVDYELKINKIKYFNPVNGTTESFEVGYRSLYQCTNDGVRKMFSDHDVAENDLENSENEFIYSTDSEGGV